MSRKKTTQITVKRNPADAASEDFFCHIENRDRELYPTIFSYLNAAVENLEVSAGDTGECPVLTDGDFSRIREEVICALMTYERRRREERMVP